MEAQVTPSSTVQKMPENIGYREDLCIVKHPLSLADGEGISLHLRGRGTTKWWKEFLSPFTAKHPFDVIGRYIKRRTKAEGMAPRANPNIKKTSFDEAG